VRSPHAHARIVSVDASVARAQPGVVTVLTGADYVTSGHGGMPQGAVSADAVEWRRGAFSPAFGHVVYDRPHMPFAVDCARYPGEMVAIVIAETRDIARAAAERVAVSYDVLPAVTDAASAFAPGAPQLWADAPGNVALDAQVMDRVACADAFARAHLVVEDTFTNPRTITAQLEPRAALGTFDKDADQYVLISGCQGAHRLRHAIAAALNVPPARVRVVVPDTGGGFGTRNNTYPEQVAVVWAAARICRPVKWTGDRAECFLTDYQGRDCVTHARLGLDRDGRILAYATEIVANIGAHTVSFTPLHNGWRVGTTIYDIPAACVHLRAALTNTVPTAPYRGAGRPEATLALESLLDRAARQLGMDRIELRRRNIVAKSRLPYHSPSGLTYDSGTFEANMDKTLALADWQGFETRRAAARQRGRLAGIGLSNYVETPVGAPHERVELTVHADGKVELRVGTQSTGQGHETSFAQVVADLLGVTPYDVRLVIGDTALVESGGGSHSDRSMRLAGTLMVEASGEIVAQGKRVAAALMNVAAENVVFEDGLFQAEGRNEKFDVFDLARAIAQQPSLPADLRRALASKKTFDGRMPAHPTGAAICEVEIDLETGMLEMMRYTTVDDAGQPVNPMILHGQAHGGIAQGVGPALVEGVAYDDSGQVLTGSFMDYCMPRAALFPHFEVALTEDATQGNPLRIKGGGEGGTTPASAAVMNAVLDALAPLGVEHVDMPATAERLWRAIATAPRRDEYFSTETRAPA
jgi:carbon-monoxide dehydrogenase large subunit